MANSTKLHAKNDEWWEDRYKLFLQDRPISQILNHAGLYMQKNDTDDFGFSIYTKVPDYGKIHNLDKRAILVGIWRSRKPTLINSDELKMTDQPLEPLNEDTAKLINYIMKLIYKDSGEPREFDNEETTSLAEEVNRLKREVSEMKYDLDKIKRSKSN